jgi:hypothetical protein
MNPEPKNIRKHPRVVVVNFMLYGTCYPPIIPSYHTTVTKHNVRGPNILRTLNEIHEYRYRYSTCFNFQEF